MAGATTAGMMLVAVILSKVILAGLFYGERAWLGREYTYQIVRFSPKNICSFFAGVPLKIWKKTKRSKKVEKSRLKSLCHIGTIYWIMGWKAYGNGLYQDGLCVGLTRHP